MTILPFNISLKISCCISLEQPMNSIMCMCVSVCAQKQILYSCFCVIICPERVCASYESPIFMGQWAACRHCLDDFHFASQNMTKMGWVDNAMLHQVVCSCIITCGRAWTTVSSSALIPVAIFNSFNTVREKEKKRVTESSTEEFSVCVHVICRWSFQKKKNKEADNRQGFSPLHLGLIPA